MRAENTHLLCRIAAALLLVSAALCRAPLCRAEEPQLQAQAGSAEIYLGESLDYHVGLRNVKTPKLPDMSALAADFDVVATGDQSQNQFSMNIVNGQVSRRESYGHLYVFKLTPKRAGDLIIPAPSVTIDGQTITARPLQLRVIGPEAQDEVIAEITTSRAKLYPTQDFEVSLRILIKPHPSDPKRDPLFMVRTLPDIQINWLEPRDGLSTSEATKWLTPFVASNGRGFTLNNLTVRDQTQNLFDRSRAAVFSLYTGREQRAGISGMKIDYFVYELKRTFSADKIGPYRFGPAMVKFNEGISGRMRRMVVAAMPKSVDVTTVPSPRPATFSGGIGNYGATVSATPAALRVGDPLTLTLEIRREAGSGSLDLISAPDLTANAKMAEDFEVIDKAPTGEIKDQVKRFSYGLRPKRTGASIPPLTLTVFNPDTEKFSDIQTQPVALKVTAGNEVKSGELVGAITRAQGQEIRSRQQGIFQNITDLGELGNQCVRPVNYLVGSIGAWFFFGALALFVSTHRKRASDPVWQRRNTARARADGSMQQARAALSGSDTGAAARHIRTALTGLIGDVLNISSAGMTRLEAEKALLSAGVSEGTRTAVLDLLESIESLEYGYAGSEPARLLERAEQTLPQLHRELEAGK